MGVKNKMFTENVTGNKIKIIDEYSNIAITSTKDKIHVSRLLDPTFYTEEIDPKDFFGEENVYNVFAEKIKGIDTTNLPEDVPINRPSDGFSQNDESAVIVDEDYDERAELEIKYGIASSKADPSQDAKRQQEAFEKILNPDPPKPRKSNHEDPHAHTPVYVEPSQVYKPEDPMLSMFKNTKRIVDFDVNLKINNKIPRLDFIEMMEDSYDTSIIEFLADEFTDKILRDPFIIKDLIIKEIKARVYPNGEPVDDSFDSNKLDVDVKISDLIKDTSINSLLGTESKSHPVEPVLASYPVLEPVVKKPKKEKKKEVVIVEAEKVDAPKPPEDRIIVEGEYPPKPKSMK